MFQGYRTKTSAIGTFQRRIAMQDQPVIFGDIMNPLDDVTVFNKGVIRQNNITYPGRAGQVGIGIDIQYVPITKGGEHTVSIKLYQHYPARTQGTSLFLVAQKIS